MNEINAFIHLRRDTNLIHARETAGGVATPKLERQGCRTPGC
jgi:hypothetical protein